MAPPQFLDAGIMDWVEELIPQLLPREGVSELIPPRREIGEASDEQTSQPEDSPQEPSTAPSFFTGVRGLGIKRGYFNNVQVININQGNNRGNSAASESGFSSSSASCHHSATTQRLPQEEPAHTFPANAPLRNREFEAQKREIDLLHFQNQLSIREQQAKNHERLLHEKTEHIQGKESDLVLRERSIQRREYELYAREKELQKMRAQTQIMLQEIMDKCPGLQNRENNNDQRPSIGASESHKLTAGDLLSTLFGVEDSKGLCYILHSFSLFKKGSKDGLAHLRFDCVPHYNGLTPKRLGRFDDSLRISIGGVLQVLIAEKRREPLTFKMVHGNLMQIPFLQCQGEPLAFHRFVKCKRNSQIARLFLDTQWILKLVKSDQPESVFDLELSRPAEVPKGAKFPPVRQDPARSSSDDGQPGQKDTLIDLAVLSFPSRNEPWFKLSHLILKVCILKKLGLTSRKKFELGVIFDHVSQNFYVRQTIMDSMKEESKRQAMQLTYSLFI